MLKKIRARVEPLLAGLRTKGSFTQNLAVAFSSNALTFVITFLFTPIFSRIYTPEAYGKFALFSTISNNVMVLVSLSFPNAFVLPRDERKFLDLVRLSFLLAFGSMIILVPFFGFSGKNILHFFNAESLVEYRWLIAPSILVSAINVIWNNWHSREKEFRRNGVAQIGAAVVSRTVGLSYGLGVGGFAPGLLLSDFAHKFTASIISVNKSMRARFTELFYGFKWSNVRETFIEYRQYPLYSLPGSWVAGFTSQLPVLVLSRFYGVSAVGQFSYANSLLNIPIQLIAFSLGSVFLQRATEIYYDTPERMPQLIKDLYLRVFYLGVIPFGVLSVYGEWIFTFILGKKWQTAGVFAGYMAYYYIFYLVSYFFSSLYVIIDKQKYNLLGHGINLGMMCLAFIPGVILQDVKLFVMLFSIGSVIAFTVNILIVFRLFRVSPVGVVVRSWLILFGVFIFLTLVKMGLVALAPSIFLK
ncbi:oligosaccharide flippase family protein [Hymenobacter busanensis]|uniref:Oligosaccharide flippase family protein n=1 Tax=Hymenobacter busanensis TaxID=2607656 RepID=A0A7L4ZZ20_9BACT|nr:oligosaccharide flippase family protein [Hymenobacter busanensis]KAA9332261.1 oligosaccharide flippase family protein [Hymenobacter busanensis]QHJ07402.1 oligosaccharide flippase family protein [Hymenobacter busanensis]